METNSLEGAARRGLQIFGGQEWWVKLLWILGVLGVGLVAAIKLLPFVIVALDNIALTMLGLLYAAALGFPLLIIILLAFNGWVHQAVLYGVDNFALKIRNLVLDRPSTTKCRDGLDALNYGRRLSSVRRWHWNAVAEPSEALQTG